MKSAKTDISCNKDHTDKVVLSDFTFSIMKALLNIMLYLELRENKKETTTFLHRYLVTSLTRDVASAGDISLPSSSDIIEKITLFTSSRDSEYNREIARSYTSSLKSLLCDPDNFKKDCSKELMVKITYAVDFYIFKCADRISYETVEMKLWSGLGFLFQGKRKAAAYNFYSSFSDLQRMEFNIGSVRQSISYFLFSLVHCHTYYEAGKKVTRTISDEISKSILLIDEHRSREGQFLRKIMDSYLSDRSWKIKLSKIDEKSGPISEGLETSSSFRSMVKIKVPTKKILSDPKSTSLLRTL